MEEDWTGGGGGGSGGEVVGVGRLGGLRGVYLLVLCLFVCMQELLLGCRH